MAGARTLGLPGFRIRATKPFTQTVKRIRANCGTATTFVTVPVFDDGVGDTVGT